MGRGHNKGGGCGFKRATGEIPVVVVLFCILTVVTDRETYTDDIIA